MEFTGERFIISKSMQNEEIYIEHTIRYQSIINLIKDKIVLDAATGDGYGANIMSSFALEVYGVDISSETIEHAKKHYKNKNLEYVEASIAKLPFPDAFFDVVVSFETIEHVDEELQKVFLKEIKRVLKNDGLLIISTPDKKYYSDLYDYHNEYHVKEFYEKEWNEFISRYFKYTKTFYQRHEVVNLITHEQTASIQNISKNLEYGKYLISLCSNQEVSTLEISSYRIDNGLYDSNISRVFELQKQLNEQNSWALQLKEENKIYIDRLKRTQEKELQLQQKELYLQEKELYLQEKEQQNIALENKVATLVEMVESMRIKNRVKRVIKKILPLNNHQAKEVAKKTIKLLAGEKNYIKLKNIYSQKQMNISTHMKLAREINFELDRVLYVFPVIDWNFRIQRPQHIASQFRNDGYKVIYFSTTFHISKNPGYFLSEIEEGILNVTLFLDENKNIYKDALNQKSIDFLLLSMLKLEKELFINRRISIIDHPFWFDIAYKLSGAFTIYDCMDYHAGFGDDSKYLIELENVAMAKSDLLILSSQDLYERFSKKNKNAILVRNGCEFSYFNTKTQLVHNNTKKQIGYYGAISSWFDADLVIELAKYYSDYDFILIGAMHGCDNVQGLKAMDNITLVGEIPYLELTKYLYSFDVCIMPFKVNELTYATNPVKVYEYLASGKPVVSTLLPEVVMMGNVVYTAKDLKEFIKKIKDAIENDSKIKQQARINFSKSNDWQSRYKMIAQKIDEVKINLPKVSIVIVTYNNLDFTKNCLESMERFNNYENCEVIIVDNLSSDGTREYLTKYEQSRDNIKVILHDENSGFAGGNNIGIKASSGDYVILLNNDTYVTPNWIVNLLKYFNDDKIAMVGPRTNNIGNESKIDIKYDSLDEMIVKSYDIYYKNVLKQYEMKVLAFFCVAIKREVIDEIGLLDEIYTIGMFEDDDYCKKIKSAGYRLVCADDVFIHHHLGASFDKDPEWKEKLFKKNKAIFESRYGEWIPHKYRMEN